MIVVDASAILEVLLLIPAAQRVGSRLFADGETLHAPHLLDIEVAQGIRRYCLSEKLDAARGQAALQDFASFALIRYPHTMFVTRIWQLRANLTAYDAAYVALAEGLCAPSSREMRRWRVRRGTGRVSRCYSPLPGCDKMRIDYAQQKFFWRRCVAARR